MLISIILPNLRGGGVERLHILLADEFIRRGYEVDFVLFRAEGELLSEVPISARVVDLQAKRLRTVFWPLVRYLRRSCPAATLASMWPVTGLAALANAVSGVNSRVIVSEHNALSQTPAYRGWSRRLHRTFGKSIYGLCDGVVSVSEGVRQDVIAGTGLAGDQISVIYNPVRQVMRSASLADPDIVAWWRGGSAKLIAIGSFKPQKDFSNLLQAFARVLQTNDARLLILGEGPLRDELEALIVALGLSDRVQMPGFVSDPYPYLAQADLFVLSSAWEGLGNVILEALVCGTPVVSTDCPSGPAEILENGRYGHLVPVGDAEALAHTITKALTASHDRDLLRRRGSEFSVERAAEQYLALLDPGKQASEPKQVPPSVSDCGILGAMP